MPQPFVRQGILQKLRASIVFTNFPGLNITSPFLGKAGIRITLTGQATVFIDQMTGRVRSLEPYLAFEAEIMLMKTNALGQLFKAQQEQNTILGDFTIRPDTKALTPYLINEGAIISAGAAMDFSGQNADFPLHIGGTYYVNSAAAP